MAKMKKMVLHCQPLCVMACALRTHRLYASDLKRSLPVANAGRPNSAALACRAAVRSTFAHGSLAERGGATPSHFRLLRTFIRSALSMQFCSPLHSHAEIGGLPHCRWWVLRRAVELLGQDLNAKTCKSRSPLRIARRAERDFLLLAAL